MKKHVFRKFIVFVLALVMAAGVLPNNTGVSAASKPKTPKITVAASDDGTSIKVTIGKTKKADGYQIVAKLPGSEEFTEVKVLEENGKKKRTFTAENLPGGTYSIKVRGYKNSKGKKVWGKYSKVQTVTIVGTKYEEPKGPDSYKVGDIVTFGSYEQDGELENGKEPIEWIILSKDESEIYVVSRYVLFAGMIDPYSSDKKVTWENCSLRDYLNSGFIAESFDEEEAAVISQTELSDVGTVDRVFLLSEYDVKHNSAIFYLDTDRRCAPTLYAEDEEEYYDENNTTHYCGVWTCDGYYKNSHFTNDGKEACYWWLRTYNADKKFSMVSESGKVIKNIFWGEEIDTGHEDEDDGERDYAEDFGVRPALKIKLTDDAMKLVGFSGENIAKEIITPDSVEDNIIDIKEAGAGDIIVFGSYEQDDNAENGPEPIKWIVLSKTGSQLMLISKYGLERVQYNTEKTDVTWERCSLRSWLNVDFYKTAFADSEKRMIVTQSTENADNKKYKTEGGNNTEDKVSLLSIDEACSKKYGFSEDSADGDINRRSAPTEYCRAQGCSIGEYKTSDGIYGGYYWTRSPGWDSQYAAHIGSKGAVVRDGTLVSKYCLARPVIVIDLEKDDDDDNWEEEFENKLYSLAAGQAENGRVIAATLGINDKENGISLLDGLVSTKFCFKGNAGFIIWEAPEALQVESYMLKTGNDTSKYKGRNPKSWILYGANEELPKDSKEWEIIDTVTNDKKMKAKNFKEYTFKLESPTKAYKYFKFEILDNKGDECTQLSELTLDGSIVK